MAGLAGRVVFLSVDLITVYVKSSGEDVRGQLG